MFLLDILLLKVIKKTIKTVSVGNISYLFYSDSIDTNKHQTENNSKGKRLPNVVQNLI